ncbi:DUF5709 domain-containing protein [Gordonia sp. CPCC 205515]|uniref:DUF5709 domain-containing protein n=1 Tax=Gordonia sp. CPCC 205515 TaxID=3140791 RepID=UPI003AF3C82F
MSDDIGSISEGSDGEYSLDPDDQLQPEDTLDDRGVDDVLDEGFSPPDHRPSGARRGLTAQEQREGETLDERLSEEEPDPWNAKDPLDDAESDWRSHESDRDDEYDNDDQAGNGRAGRLVAAGNGDGDDNDADTFATDCGIDGAGASAEEAAVHYIDEDEVERSERDPD